jgi:hypothetical protein
MVMVIFMFMFMLLFMLMFMIILVAMAVSILMSMLMFTFIPMAVQPHGSADYFENAGIPNLPLFVQSGNGMKQNNDAGTSRVPERRGAVRHFLFRYRTDTMDAGMPMLYVCCCF